MDLIDLQRRPRKLGEHDGLRVQRPRAVDYYPQMESKRWSCFARRLQRAGRNRGTCCATPRTPSACGG